MPLPGNSNGGFTTVDSGTQKNVCSSRINPGKWTDLTLIEFVFRGVQRMVVMEQTQSDQRDGEECGIPVHLYHGGMTGSITSFYWGSHFGTRDQALFAILAKGILDNHNNVPSAPYLYECKHSLQARDVSRMRRDWGSPFYSAALRMYLSTLGRERRRKDLWEQYDLDDRSNDGRAFTLLKEELANDHCKALSYKNLIEGSALSYMIWDPADVFDIIEIIPCKEELYNAFKQDFLKLVPCNELRMKRKLLEDILSFCPSC